MLKQPAPTLHKTTRTEITSLFGDAKLVLDETPKAISPFGLKGTLAFYPNTSWAFDPRQPRPTESKPAEAPGGAKLKVTLRPDGPLRLDGEMQVFDSGDRLAWQGVEAALCRCGASKNKPFCDGSHREAGFVAE